MLLIRSCKTHVENIDLGCDPDVGSFAKKTISNYGF